MALLSNDNAFQIFFKQGLNMVITVTKLMDLLLQYREVMFEEDSANRMSCIVNLLVRSLKLYCTNLLIYLY